MEYKFEKLEGLKIKSINDFRKGLNIPYNSVARAIESENLDFVLISGKKYVVMNLLAEIFLKKDENKI